MSNNTRSGFLHVPGELAIEDKSNLCADLGGTGRPAGGGGGLQTSLLENSNFLKLLPKNGLGPPPPSNRQNYSLWPTPFFFKKKC